MTGKRDDITRPRDDADADAPLTDEEFDRGYGATLARRARTAAGLSAGRLRRAIRHSTASLRDWEQGRRAPDAATQSYLRVIARMPEAVARALHDAA